MVSQEVRAMWISRKKYQALEKRVADLEGIVQSQLLSTKNVSISLNGASVAQAVCKAIDDNHSSSHTS